MQTSELEGAQCGRRTEMAMTSPLSRSNGRCPVCGTKVLVQGIGEVLVKNAILRIDSASGRVSAKCARCKTWVEVPLRYTA